MLRPVAQASDRGVGVALTTHDPHPARPVGVRFPVRGRGPGDHAKGEVGVEERTRLPAGGADLDDLTSPSGRPQPEKERG